MPSPSSSKRDEFFYNTNARFSMKKERKTLEKKKNYKEHKKSMLEFTSRFPLPQLAIKRLAFHADLAIMKISKRHKPHGDFEFRGDDKKKERKNEIKE